MSKNCSKSNEIFFLTIILLFSSLSSEAISVNPDMAHRIGEKIWKNECAGTVEGLTNWKKGENFASLGIGHFIWYSNGKREKYEETFPDLLLFLKNRGVVFPSWLRSTQECPWNSREEFYDDFQSQKMKSLRKFLFDTKDLQAIFVVRRFERAFTQIVKRTLPQERKKIEKILEDLGSSANGLYAVIDYVNFKGTGISSSESYKGKGWGLLQVLQNMPDHTENVLNDFVQSAKTVLQRRVENSPPEREEKRWLNGWFNRLDNYLEVY